MWSAEAGWSRRKFCVATLLPPTLFLTLEVLKDNSNQDVVERAQRDPVLLINQFYRSPVVLLSGIGYIELVLHSVHLCAT
jgi:hypothetical protein